MLLFVCNCLHGSLLDKYKEGVIRIKPVPGYAASNDGDIPLFNAGPYMAFLPNGNMFLSNSSEHFIMKFDAGGNYKGKFGIKGTGPGDLYYPGVISVLDNRYLVVAEYASSRRFSVFSLKGKFIKMIKTSRAVFSPIALKDNKVAYLSYKHGRAGKNRYIKTSVYMIDIQTKKEIMVTSVELPDKSTIKLSPAMSFKLGNNVGEVVLAGTYDGDLMAGISNSNLIRVFALTGKVKQTIRLDIKPKPVTGKYIKNYKSAVIRDMEGGSGSRPMPKRIIKSIKKYSFERMFAGKLPYYRGIQVDSQGNLLVFLWPDFAGEQENKFQVYSPQGKYICETKIEEGDYHIGPEESSKSVYFTNTGIYGLFRLKTSENDEVQLIKVEID